MIGISTTYFAIRGNTIYDSVTKARELGFGMAELGATHNFEKDIPGTLKRIKKDFAEMHFTLHGLFPPLEKKVWFNPPEGLNALNRKIVEGFFSAAEIVEADLVSFHPGFSHTVVWGKDKNGLNLPEYKEPIQREKAFRNSFEVFSLAQKLAEDTGIEFAIENIPFKGRDKPLFISREDFLPVFEKFQSCGFLLDYGHAMFSENLEEMLSMANAVKQMHVHYSFASSAGNGDDNHLTIPSRKELEPLSSIRQLPKIPLIFEHGLSVNEGEIVMEKNLLESFLKEKF